MFICQQKVSGAAVALLEHSCPFYWIIQLPRCTAQHSATERCSAGISSPFAWEEGVSLHASHLPPPTFIFWQPVPAAYLFQPMGDVPMHFSPAPRASQIYDIMGTLCGSAMWYIQDIFNTPRSQAKTIFSHIRTKKWCTKRCPSKMKKNCAGRTFIYSFIHYPNVGEDAAFL